MSSQPPPSLPNMRKQIKPLRVEQAPFDLKAPPPPRMKRVLEGLMPQRPRGMN